MNTKTMSRLRSLAIVLGFLIPTITLAAPPPAVTGLSGTQEANGEVRIEWQPSTDSSVVRYRLYYSSESILESGGVYDDFEETQGTENVFVFTTPPVMGSLYVTVLAVNNVGEESESFVEEVHIDLAQAAASSEAPRLEQSSRSMQAQSSSAASVLMVPSSSSSSASVQSIPTYTEPVDDGRVHLLLAEALSPIQVKLTFSGPVTVDPQAAPQAFMIVGPGGAPLPITQILVSDTVVVADTQTQQKGAVYNVKLSEPLQGTNSQPLDATDRTAFFTGHELGTDQTAPVVPTAPVVTDPTKPADVMGFSLHAVPELGGTYTVVAQWQADITRGDIAHYAVRQSLDGGQTFGQPQMVPMDIAGVEFAGVQPGMFGISLQVVNVYGATSTGVFDSVTLAGNGAVPTMPPVQGSVTPPVWPTMPPVGSVVPSVDVLTEQRILAEIRARNLANSGFGLFAVGSSCIGAYAGWRKMKKGTKK